MCADSRVSDLSLASECSSATKALLPVAPGSPPTATTRNSNPPPPTASPLTVAEGTRLRRERRDNDETDGERATDGLVELANLGYIRTTCTHAHQHTYHLCGDLLPSLMLTIPNNP